ncbi:uncharacterized protein LOC106639330 [Copidosoma floridanum]|uniref:uncharacterized protein LOC106639330 n=1 Tax=Copidosoma floridanum TaxID=29053 RepID=UPI000C6F5B9A|nr:uncharacterized protein LOC106639330 [Copidosoma floridanum]
MAPLPASRVTPSRAFGRTGVDYAGPFSVLTSKGRGIRTTKGYIAVFVCMTTKAVHLELVGDLSAANFLGALTRFTGRRGRPSELWSVNATCFRRADLELREALQGAEFNWDLVAGTLASQGVFWQFIPPGAPHFGGLWEAAVKLTKSHPCRVLGSRHLTYKEFSTVLVGIKAVLNSRPLTPLSGDPSDLKVLTPGHFLIGAPVCSKKVALFAQSSMLDEIDKEPPCKVASISLGSMTYESLITKKHHPITEFLNHQHINYDLKCNVTGINRQKLISKHNHHKNLSKWFFGNLLQGSAIEKLCECAIEENLTDREAVVRAAKCLLGAVTRVLLLADITVVKQLLMAKDKVARSLGRLESVSNFTEFVKAFSQFGAEMVELAHMTGDRQLAGSAIEKLCECAIEENLTDREAVVRAAKCLLGAVTRVLLLADITVVKQLLMAKDKVARSLGRLESVSNFTEFVKAFSQFGAEMVELAHMTGDRQNDLKDERRRAQMAAARQVLERSTMMLLTSSKACLRHPECPSAKENRDTVFCQMRRAMDLIHYVVKDGVLDCSESTYANSQSPQQEDWDSSTVFAALKQFERLVESTRLTLLSAGCRETLTAALDVVVERTQDFTDSAYTSHEHRENILLLCDRAKLELNTLLRVGNSMNFEVSSVSGSPSSELDQAILAVLQATRDLRQQLCQTTMEQAGDLGQVTKAGQELVSTIRNLSLASDIDRLQESSDRFHEYIDHILEVCKLLRHVALSESLQVSAKFTEINLRIYGPQVVTAAHTLARHPTSKIAKENLEVFADMWQWLMSDVTTVAKDVLELSQSRPEKQVYMSLPRPGKHGTTSKPLKPVRLDSEEQAKIAKAGLEMKRITSEMDAETEKWQENGSTMEENNDIVKRAKNMSSMAFSMYQFTRGEGALKTTQDLFTQAEYFAEEANRLYKVVRQFSYQVPGGPHKKELLENLDRVPTYVQQLQFTVKNPTVGKAATFVKVDNVIQETKNLMNVISKVVTTCFVCATKHNLSMPQFVDVNPASVPGLGEEDCLYPISPQMLPNAKPYVQPHPLTLAQLYTIVKQPAAPSPSPPPQPPSPSMLHDYLDNLSRDQTKTPIIQHYYFDHLPPSARESSQLLFPATTTTRNMADSNMATAIAASAPPDNHNQRYYRKGLSRQYQYNLDFRGLSVRGAGGSPYRGGDGAGADGDGSGAGGDGSKVGSAPGSDPSV